MGLVATLLAAVIIIPSDWTASTAVFVYTAAHIVAIVVGASQIRLPLMTCLNVEIWSTLSQLNLGGRWAALSSCLYSLRGNAHTLIVAVAIGPGAVAAVNAARLFVTPATLLIPAISNHALPQLARTAAQSEREVFTKVWLQTVAGLLFIAIAYGFVLIAVWPIASQRFLPEEYLGAGPLVILWWLYACMLCIRSGLEWGNQALGAFAKMSQVNIVGALVALAAVSVLTSTLGPIGSIVGLIIAEIVVIFGFIGLLKR
jgi:O-antigen/teichoic acid export membrane protein